MKKFTFHLIPNAHLDPVWLWDWREGLNEGLVTCRTILDMMDADGELTFIRGETAIYEHIEQTDPATFERIAKYVKEGRWDPVGGTVIQPDTNLPDTETFARHFAHGQRYLTSRFGKPSRVAWAADSFGHAAGLPEILSASGIKFFAFTRPSETIVPIAKPVFWWEGPGASRILAYRPPIGWYGCEREEMTKRLDGYLEQAKKGDLQNVGAFFGLGNHGGGPTRRHLEEIRAWADAHHDEVKMIFSGLHKFFGALQREIKTKPKTFLPVHRGELNFVLRGCYSSLAKFKFMYRKTENLLLRAEKADALIRSMAVPPMPARSKERAVDRKDSLHNAWHDLLFNSFHDILPGSSIERAFDDQIAWLGGAYHAAQKVEFAALNALAARVDTRVETPEGDMPSGVAMLVWNPHPHPYRGPIELESSLDYRPIWKYHKKVDELPLRVRGGDGADLPHQVVDTEHHSMVELAWRKRVVIDADLPAFGWNVIEMAYVEGATSPEVKNPVRASGGEFSSGEISNGLYTIRAAVGKRGVEVLHKGVSIFSNNGLSAITVEDPWGSWGGMAEEKDSFHLDTVRHHWTISDVRVLEKGPLRAALWVQLKAGESRMELSLSLSRGREAVDVSARVLWNERSARLKLVFPAGDRAEFQVPGATVERSPNLGQVPGGRWVRVTGPRGLFGLASDALYDFDCSAGEFRATICRASRYADDVNTPADHEPWRAAVDAGELKFKFLMSPGDARLPILARELEQPPVALLVPPHASPNGPSNGGNLGRTGSLAELGPQAIEILALKPAEDGNGLILRLQETKGRPTQPKLKLFGATVRLPLIAPHRIATFRLRSTGRSWKATPTDSTEGI
jgi:alpha-mannosidase